jgi:soluble lytic murein transglycosylase-like protein
MVYAHLVLVIVLAWLNGLAVDRRMRAPLVAPRQEVRLARVVPARARLQPRQPGDLRRFDRHILDAARWYGVDPYLVRAVILAESGANPWAVSPRDARGLMQLLPSTGRSLGAHRTEDLFDPRTNIFLGTKYIGQLLADFNGDPARALAAYNAGPQALLESRRLPAETRAYVPRVLRLWAELRRSGQGRVT